MGAGGAGSHGVQHVLGGCSVDHRGGMGGTAAERGFEETGSCKHAVSVEANACDLWRLKEKVAGVGDDFGPSSAVDALEQDMEKVYNT